MSRMRISVAMSVCNGEAHLGALLESLESQTRPPDELVVNDDASEDGTAALLDAFARGASFPVRVESAGERLGHAEGFLRAASLCDGDAIAFCDQDDVWLDRKLEVAGAALERPGVTAVLHRVRVVDDQLREVAPPWPAMPRAGVVPPLRFTGLHLDAPGMALLFRRSLLDLADPARRPHSRYNTAARMMHDEWVMVIAGVMGSIHLLPEPLVLYRQHGGNFAGWFERERRVTFEPLIGVYEAAAEYTDACARHLAEIEVRDPELARRVEAGVRHYGAQAERWRLRMALYGTSGLRARARVFRKLVAARAYGPRVGGGFGGRAIAKDLVGGVCLRSTA